MKLKKYFSVFLIFLFFINAGGIEDAEIKITANRADQENLVISWSINGVENVDDVVLEVLFENPAAGQVENPLIVDDITMDELTSSRIIPWDGESKLFIKLKISTMNFVQYTGDDCNHTFCLRENIEEFESEVFEIDSVPTLPPVPTTIVEVTAPEPEPEDDSTVGSIEFTNALITTIPLFSDIDFSNQAKNAFAFGITSMIIFLFYAVLLAQEWFNRIISHYRVKWTKKETVLQEKTRLETFMEISLMAMVTSLIYAFVEEGFTFSVEPQNLAIFLGVLFGLVIVTFSYEGIESLIEYFVNKSILFSLCNCFTLSTLDCAPLNSSLLCINVTLEFFDNSIAQSSALSPPPKITTDLPLKMVLSFIEYKTDFPSNFSQFLVGNFLGSKDPTPPAIIILVVKNSLPLEVFTNHLSFSFFIS